MPVVEPEPEPGSRPSDYDLEALYQKLTRTPLRLCPQCRQGHMVVVETLAPIRSVFIDTS